MPITLESLEIAFRANTNQATGQIKSLQRTINGMQDKGVSVTADTSDAKKKIDEVETQVAGMKDGGVNISADAKDAINTISQVQTDTDNLKDGSLDISADAAQALGVISDVQTSADSLVGKGITITGNGQDALDDIQSVKDQMASLPATETFTLIAKDGYSQTFSDMKSKANILGGVLKGAGLIAAGKKVFDFVVDAAQDAGDAKQVQQKLEALYLDSPDEYGALEKYIGSMQSTYGLNPTKLRDMAASFTTFFKSDNVGFSAKDAAEMSMRMMRQSIDYASFFNRSPAEVGDMFMQLLKGSYEVGDNIGFPVNTSLVDAWAKDAGIIANEGDADFTSRAMAIVGMLESNAQSIGLTGDWDRTFQDYSNQSTVLSDQLQTLKENMGEAFLQAVAPAVGALNDLIGAMNGLFEQSKKSSFVQSMENYLGTAEISDSELKALSDRITSEVSAITDGVTQAQQSVDAAVNNFSSAYQKLMKYALLMYTGNYQGAAEEDELAGLVNQLRDASTAAAQEGKTNWLTQYLLFASDDPAFTEGKEKGLALIEDYYGTMISKVEEKASEMAKAAKRFYDEMTPENFAQLQQAALELSQATYESAYGDIQAAQHKKMMELKKSGQWSALSMEEIQKQLIESSAEYEKLFDEQFAGMIHQMTKMALSQGLDPEEVTAPLYAQYEQRKQNMLTNTYDTLARGMYDATLGMLNTANNSLNHYRNVNPGTPHLNASMTSTVTQAFKGFENQIGPILDLFGEEIQKGTATQDMIRFYNDFNPFLVMSRGKMPKSEYVMTPEEKAIAKSNQEYERYDWEGRTSLGSQLLYYVGSYLDELNQGNPFSTTENDLWNNGTIGANISDPIVGSIGELKGSVDALASRPVNVSLTVSGYRFGKIANESAQNYQRVGG